MQFTPAGASAAHKKLGAGPSGPSVKAASASGAPERARVAQSAKLMASGHRVRVCGLVLCQHRAALILVGAARYVR